MQRNILSLRYFSLIFTVLLCLFTFSKIYANTNDLQELLKSEVDIDIEKDKLEKLPKEKQEELEQRLKMLQKARALFSGEREKAIRILTEFIEMETTSSTRDVFLETLLKVTNTPVEEAKGITDTIKKYAIVIGTLKAIDPQSQAKERIILDYISRRNGVNSATGKFWTDEEVWKEIETGYFYFDDNGFDPVDPIVGTGETQIGVIIYLLRDKEKNEALHTNAEMLYSYYSLVKQLDSDPQIKEQFKQQILDEISTQTENQEDTSEDNSIFPENIITQEALEIRESSEDGQYKTILTGKHLKNVTIGRTLREGYVFNFWEKLKDKIGLETFNDRNSTSYVGLDFNQKGTRIFTEATQRNIGKEIAIYVDGQLVSSPRVQQEITEGRASIGGLESEKEAEKLKTSLEAGMDFTGKNQKGFLQRVLQKLGF
jgi:hypothetical protein